MNGNGWAVSDLPYLVIKMNSYSWNHGGILSVVQGGSNGFEFTVNPNSTTYSPRFDSVQSLVYVPGYQSGSTYVPGTFQFRASDGSITTFYDVERYANDTLADSVTGAKYGSQSQQEGVGYGHAPGYTQGVTRQWFDPTTGAESDVADPYRFGAFKSWTDPSGKVTANAIYDSSGNLTDVVRTSTDYPTLVEKFHYDNSTHTNNLGASAPMTDSVTLLRSSNSGVTFTSIRSVDYTYYSGSSTATDRNYGRFGDLKQVVIKDYQHNPSGDVVDKKYYRYYKFGNYSWYGDASVQGPTNQIASTGGPDNWDGVSAPTDSFYASSDNSVSSGLRSVFEDTSYARLAANLGDISTFDSLSDSAVNSYASNVFTYQRVNSGTADYPQSYGGPQPSFYRVTSEVVAGSGCSTCSGGFGTYTLDYHVARQFNPYNYGSGWVNSFDTNTWYLRTTESLPDNTPADTADNDQNIVYTNELGAIVLQVTVERNGTDTTSDDKEYLTYYRYDAQGHVVQVAHPSAFKQYGGAYYDESLPDLVGWSTTSNYVQQNSGLIDDYSYGSSTTAGSSAGDVTGYLKQIGVQKGFAGSVVPVSSQNYFAHTYNGATVYPVANTTEYRDVNGDGTDDANTTSRAYAWLKDGSGIDTNRIASLTVTLPTVATTRNGSGTGNTELMVFDSVGRPVWTQDSSGFITYTEYDPFTGDVSKQIADVNTSKTTDFTGLPSGWATPTGGGLHLITTIVSEGLGRPTKVTDPNGNITYIVYNDGNHETRTYTTATGTFAEVGPIAIHRVYWPAQSAAAGQRQVYSEDITSNATVSLTSGVPDGKEAISSSNIQSLSRSLTNDAGQTTDFDQYTSLSSVTYSALTAALGTAGVNYLATSFAYDDRGRKKRTQSPDGTVTRTLYDARNLVIGTWKGTDDTPTSGYWSPSNQSGTNLLKVSSAVYDVDGNLTQSRQVLSNDTLGGDGSNYETDYAYDFRDRLTDVRGPDGIATKYTYDNGGNQTETDTYADLDSDFTIDAGELIGKSTVAYDDQGRAYQATQYQNARQLDTAALTSTGTTATVTLVNHGFTTGQSVTIAGASQSAYNGTFTITVTGQNTFTYTLGSSLTGTATGTRITVQADKRLTGKTWYDARGNIAKTLSPSGLISKQFYDGANRLVQNDISADTTEVSSGTYADALSLMNDQVIEQNDYRLDAGGRTRIATNWKRPGTSTSGGTGLPTEATFDHTSIVYYYDAANRLVDSLNFGRDGAENGSTTSDRFVWNASGYSYVDANNNGIIDVLDHAQDYDPGTSYTGAVGYEWIYTRYWYDDAGRLQWVHDNADRWTETLYDLAGRTTATIEDYTGTGAVTGTTPGDQNRTTQYVYDAQGRLSKQIALNPKGGSTVEQQVTQYVYGSDIDRSWVTATLYPDSAATVSVDSSGKGTVSGSDATFATYDRLGRQATTTDQRGVIHTFGYDAAGRFASDALTTLPSGVNNKVQSIGYSYDTEGRTATVTSYGTSSLSSLVNQVAYVYDGWGNVTKDAESHYSAVTSTTPAVNYLYADGSGTGITASYVRLSRVQYPTNNNGSIGTYIYSYETSAFGAVLNRLGAITDASSTPVTLATYGWLGLDTSVSISRPQVSGGLLVSYGSLSDDFVGFDRYYRTSYINWQNTANSTQFNLLVYWYDRMGNVLFRKNVSTGTGSTNWSATYTYDGLNRLTGYTRGVMSSNTITGSNIKFAQSWTLDSLGNWAGYSQTNSDTSLSSTTFPTFAQTRTANAANEITGTTGTSGTGGTYAGTSYDAAGNQTLGPKTGATSTQLGYVYDGWNRLVGVDLNHDGDLYDAGDVQYSYDGTGRRITKSTDTVNDSTNNAATTEEYYQDEQNQVLEVRTGTTASNVTTINGNPKERYLWDVVYIDSPVFVEYDTNQDGTPDQRLYATTDDNHNIASLVTAGGKTVERYEYTPYGQQIVLNGASNYAGTTTGTDNDGGTDWTIDSNGSDFGFLLGFQGLRMDAETGNWYARARYKSPAQGNWTQRDPLGTKYQDGSNIYLAMLSNPLVDVDPLGKDAGWARGSGQRDAYGYYDKTDFYDLFKQQYRDIDDILRHPIPQSPTYTVQICQSACEGANDGLLAWIEGALPGQQFGPNDYYDPNDWTLQYSQIGGQVSQTAWSTAFLLPSGPAGTVARWGTAPRAGNWVMKGGATWRNWIMSGKILTSPGKCFVIEVGEDALRFPGSKLDPIAWAKWLIGQRIMK